MLSCRLIGLRMTFAAVFLIVILHEFLSMPNIRIRNLDITNLAIIGDVYKSQETCVEFR